MAGLTVGDTAHREWELDALPSGAYVLGHDGFRHAKVSAEDWLLCVDTQTTKHSVKGIELPALVLYVPQGL